MTAGTAFLGSLRALLLAQRPSYRPAGIRIVRLATGQDALHIWFAAPEPLGLLDASQPLVKISTPMTACRGASPRRGQERGTMTQRAWVRPIRRRLAGCAIRRALAACAMTLGVLAAVAPVTMASAAVAAAPSAGWLRLANLSPGAPTFDIYLYPLGNMHARLVLRNVSYGMVSGYQAVPVGGYTVAMRMAGKPATSLPVLSATISVAAGRAYTMASVGPSSGSRLELFPDPVSTPEGKALVRVIQASLHQNRVTVTAGRHVLVRGLASGTRPRLPP